MNGYGAVGDARKRMLDGHENYSAEVWRERAQEQAHRASQAEAKVAELRAEVADLRDRLARVQALADRWERYRHGDVFQRVTAQLRAALGDADTLAGGCVPCEVCGGPQDRGWHKHDRIEGATDESDREKLTGDEREAMADAFVAANRAEFLDCCADELAALLTEGAE